MVNVTKANADLSLDAQWREDRGVDDERAKARTELLCDAKDVIGEIPHQELGVAIRTSKNNARSIAELFVQNAFFWFDGANFWIEPACEKKPATRV